MTSFYFNQAIRKVFLLSVVIYLVVKFLLHFRIECHVRNEVFEKAANSQLKKQVVVYLGSEKQLALTIGPNKLSKIAPRCSSMLKYVKNKQSLLQIIQTVQKCYLLCIFAVRSSFHMPQEWVDETRICFFIHIILTTVCLLLPCLVLGNFRIDYAVELIDLKLYCKKNTICEKIK